MECAKTVVKMVKLEHTVPIVRDISLLYWHFLHWSLNLLIFNGNKRFWVISDSQEVITFKAVPFSVLQFVKHVTRMDCALVRKGELVQIVLTVITYNENSLQNLPISTAVIISSELLANWSICGKNNAYIVISNRCWCILILIFSLFAIY